MSRVKETAVLKWKKMGEAIYRPDSTDMGIQFGGYYLAESKYTKKGYMIYTPNGSHSDWRGESLGGPFYRYDLGGTPVFSLMEKRCEDLEEYYCARKKRIDSI